MGVILNLDKINPIKREKVRKGMEFVDKMNAIEPVVDKVIVFGSSVRDDCTEESDIDLCLFTNYDTSNKTFFKLRGNLPIVMDDLCDVLKYSKINKDFKCEIEKGVIVYER